MSDAKRYAGGMASTVELFDWYRFAIGSEVPDFLGGQQRVSLASLPIGRSGGDGSVARCRGRSGPFTDLTKMLFTTSIVRGRRRQ